VQLESGAFRLCDSLNKESAASIPCASTTPPAEALAFGQARDIIHLMNWREHILSDSRILRGKPCIKGTRIPVALILGHLATARDAAAIQREFPDLTPADVAACLDYARDLAEFAAVPA